MKKKRNQERLLSLTESIEEKLKNFREHLLDKNIR